MRSFECATHAGGIPLVRASQLRFHRSGIGDSRRIPTSPNAIARMEGLAPTRSAQTSHVANTRSRGVDTCGRALLPAYSSDVGTFLVSDAPGRTRIRAASPVPPRRGTRSAAPEMPSISGQALAGRVLRRHCWLSGPAPFRSLEFCEANPRRGRSIQELSR